MIRVLIKCETLPAAGSGRACHLHCAFCTIFFFSVFFLGQSPKQFLEKKYQMISSKEDQIMFLMSFSKHGTVIVIFFSRSTILAKLDTNGSKELTFEPGDHVAVFPANRASLVQQLINMMHEKPDPNWLIKIEVAREDSGKQDRRRL